MIGAVAGVMLDILVAALLAVTIGYCWVLNRRIRVLQDGRGELAQLLKHFDESTQRASESIIALQTASKKIGENIQFRIDKANYLLDDLSFMIEKGGKLVSQMEAGIAVSRARSRALAEPAQLVKEQEEYLPDLLPMPMMEKPEVKIAEKPSSREKASASLEAVLGRVIGRARSAHETEAEPPLREAPKQSRARSKAEQELLEMIRAGIKG